MPSDVINTAYVELTAADRKALAAQQQMFAPEAKETADRLRIIEDDPHPDDDNFSQHD